MHFMINFNIKRLIKPVVAIVAAFSAAVLLTTSFAAARLPSSFNVAAGYSLDFCESSRISAQENLDNPRIINANANFTNMQNTAQLRMFGILPIKDVEINTVERAHVKLGGSLFGIKIFTQGVLVVGSTQIETATGLVNPAQNAGIRVGDVIEKINGIEINSNEEVGTIVRETNGDVLLVDVRRRNMVFQVEVDPVMCISENMFRVGLWVRDSSAGLGTLTFIDPQSNVAAGLGHAVSDVDTGEILPLSSGEMVQSEIINILPSNDGIPGEIRGRFLNEPAFGQIIKNNETGLYGIVNNFDANTELIEVAKRHEVKQGAAQIKVTIDNEVGPEFFDIIIENVNFSDNRPTQNMVVRITDERLLVETNGIVQGMSGSPIVQNGRLVGAITHVFVNDIQRGYAIFAENMLEQARAGAQALNRAS